MNKKTEANKRWQEQNREKARYLRNRSTSRNFLKKQATLQDIEEAEQIIRERRLALERLNNIVQHINNGKELLVKHGMFYLKAKCLNYDNDFIELKINKETNTLIIKNENIKNIEIKDQEIILSLDIKECL